MLKQDFTIGPFTIAPTGAVGPHRQRFSVIYIAKHGAKYSAEIVTDAATQASVADASSETITNLRNALKADNESTTLITLTNMHGNVINGFHAAGVLPDMTPGLIDDRSDYWLVDESGRYSLDVNLAEYAHQRARHELPKRAWIADLLPGDILTTDPDEWRAPTAWEIRHLVGEGSFIGISGAKAAALVGVNPSSFRKYTAQDGAKSRQNMSFAMWHLLLHRLGVQTMRAGAV
ncbi:hypothetical protein [Vreelandella indica]|uniref:hypothetical protein n=1 Tax=Vreelandella indica TaxID=3126500 RepID=UPI00300E13BD